jgi:hypothetical protein
MNSSLFASLTIEYFFGAVLLITFAAVFAGFLLGKGFRDRGSDHDAPPIGSVTGALFALLAFMLALTFSSASGRYDARKQLLLDEVNNIGTSYLRASFLSADDASRSRALLTDYVSKRVNVLEQDVDLQALLEASEQIHQELWDIVVQYPKQGADTKLVGLYINSLNDLIDSHTSRVVIGVQYHVHSSIWLALLTISVLSMAAIGFQFAYSGGRRVWLCLILATTFSLVLLLIEDLDRPNQGSVRVDQSPVKALLESMQSYGSLKP